MRMLEAKRSTPLPLASSACKIYNNAIIVDANKRDTSLSPCIPIPIS